MITPFSSNVNLFFKSIRHTFHKQLLTYNMNTKVATPACDPTTLFLPDVPINTRDALQGTTPRAGQRPLALAEDLPLLPHRTNLPKRLNFNVNIGCPGEYPQISSREDPEQNFQRWKQKLRARSGTMLQMI